MAAKKPTPEEAALDAQLFAMLTTAGGVEDEGEAEVAEPPKPKAAAKPEKASGWGSKK